MNCSMKMTVEDVRVNEMNVFDSLPEKLRDFINYNVEGFDVRTVYRCFRNNNFNLDATVEHLNNVGVTVWMG